MKRDPRLQHLSREHHHALTLAKACQRAAAGGDARVLHDTCRRVLHEMESELEPHFVCEEQTWLPLLAYPEAQPLIQRTLSDHRALRALREAVRVPQASALAAFGERLVQHVHFEERELFPALERRLD